MDDLNAVASDYYPNGATEIKNDLVLHWYTKRILFTFNFADSLLELGLEQGFTAELFVIACNGHVIVDGATTVIDQFKQRHSDFTGELVMDCFETYTPAEHFAVIAMGFVLELVEDPDLILNATGSS